jgi:hypothetical protein
MHTIRPDRNMHRLRLDRVAFAFLFCLVLASPSAAQTRVRTPDKGVIGYGVDAGVLFPNESLENTFTWDGFGEYYVTPRLSVRGMLAFASPGFVDRDEDNFRQVKLLFSGVYNWEKGSWRPFGLFGAGAYFVKQHLDGQTDPDGETRGGINFGGGAEYVMNTESSIKIELRWDVVSHPTGLPDATGTSLTVGYKRYF